MKDFFVWHKKLFPLKNVAPKHDEIVRLRHVLKIKYDHSIKFSNDSLSQREMPAGFFQAKHSTDDTSVVDVAYLSSTPGCVVSGEKFLTGELGGGKKRMEDPRYRRRLS